MRPIDNKLKTILLVWVIVMIVSQTGWASDSPGGLVGKSIEAYNAKDYKKALELLSQASVNDPESPVIQFNKGICYYRMDALDEADSLFSKAASNSEASKEIRAQAIYNRGNTAVSESEKSLASGDIATAIDLLKNAALFYKDASEQGKGTTLEKDALHNLEVVQLRVKNLADKLQKAREEEEKRKQRMRNLTDRLRGMIRREGDIVVSLPGHEKDEQSDAVQTRHDYSELPALQDTNLVETVAVMDTLRNMTQGAAIMKGLSGTGDPGQAAGKTNLSDSTMTQSPFTEAAKLLESALSEENRAGSALAAGSWNTAVHPAEKSKTLMEEALQKLTEQKNGNNSQQSQQGENQQGNQAQQQKERRKDSGNQNRNEQNKNDSQMNQKEQQKQSGAGDRKKMTPREANEELARLRNQYADEKKQLMKELARLRNQYNDKNDTARRGYREKNEQRYQVDKDW